MISKQGDYKWGIMLSMILGLMVLSLSLYFIFHELWSEEDTERQICRQSVQLRALLPDVERAGITIDSFKDEFPLKCKTHVVEIDARDIREKDAGKKIAEAMAECWALYGKGDENAFPAKFFKSSSCVPCARIHLTNEAKVELGDDTINIRSSLDLPMGKDYSYYSFLKNSGKKFSAFDFGNGVPFNLEGDGFEIVDVDWIWENVELRDRLGGEFSARMESVDVSLPEFFYADRGDLLINYGIVTIGDDNFDYVPYLFYFQTEHGSPFDEVRKGFVFNFWAVPKGLLSLGSLKFLSGVASLEEVEKMRVGSVGFCNEWEGIPG